MPRPTPGVTCGRGTALAPPGAREALDLAADPQALAHELAVQRGHIARLTEELGRAQAAFDELHERHTALQDLTPLGYVVIDGAAAIRSTNRTFAELLGVARWSLVGRPFETLVTATHRASFRRLCAAIAGGGRPAAVDLPLTRRDGTSVWVLLQPRPSYTRSDPVWFALVTDVSPLKETQARLEESGAELRRKLAAEELLTGRLRELTVELAETEARERRQLAGRLHDDLQQVLMAARFHLEALQLGLTGDEDREAARTVAELLREAVATSRNLTAELSPPVLAEPDFGVALRWLADWCRRRFDLAVALTLEPGDGGAGLTVNDRAARAVLFTAVRELLFNVRKHSGVDSAEVTLSLGAPSLLRVAVRDAGRGLRASERTRRDPADPQNGLVGIRERLGYLGGRMSIRSAPGEGTTVVLDLPLS